MKMTKPFITIQPKFNYGLSISLATVYICTIYICIISNLQGSFFCGAYSSRAHLDCNKGEYHDLCGNAFISIQMDLNGSRYLGGIKNNQWPKNCG